MFQTKLQTSVLLQKSELIVLGKLKIIYKLEGFNEEVKVEKEFEFYKNSFARFRHCGNYLNLLKFMDLYGLKTQSENFCD